MIPNRPAPHRSKHAVRAVRASPGVCDDARDVARRPGIFSFRDLGVDLFPRADPATVNVSLRLPGAAPDEMTSAVIMPMENALSGIAGIDQMSATVSAGGTATITVRFLLERDLDDAANSVREKVAGAMRRVPPEVLPPIIQKQDPDADPIMTARARRASRRACGRSPKSPTSR